MRNTRPEPVMLPIGHLTSKKEAEKSEEEQQNIDTYLSAGQPVMLPAQHIQAKAKVKTEDKPENFHKGAEPPMLPTGLSKPQNQ